MIVEEMDFTMQLKGNSNNVHNTMYIYLLMIEVVLTKIVQNTQIWRITKLHTKLLSMFNINHTLIEWMKILLVFKTLNLYMLFIYHTVNPFPSAQPLHIQSIFITSVPQYVWFNMCSAIHRCFMDHLHATFCFQ